MKFVIWTETEDNLKNIVSISTSTSSIKKGSTEGPIDNTELDFFKLFFFRSFLFGKWKDTKLTANIFSK